MNRLIISFLMLAVFSSAKANLCTESESVDKCFTKIKNYSYAECIKQHPIYNSFSYISTDVLETWYNDSSNNGYYTHSNASFSSHNNNTSDVISISDTFKLAMMRSCFVNQYLQTEIKNRKRNIIFDYFMILDERQENEICKAITDTNFKLFKEKIKTYTSAKLEKNYNNIMCNGRTLLEHILFSGNFDMKQHIVNIKKRVKYFVKEEGISINTLGVGNYTLFDNYVEQYFAIKNIINSKHTSAATSEFYKSALMSLKDYEKVLRDEYRAKYSHELNNISDIKYRCITDPRPRFNCYKE